VREYHIPNTLGEAQTIRYQWNHPENTTKTMMLKVPLRIGIWKTACVWSTLSRYWT
jgi:hypothetical protein